MLTEHAEVCKKVGRETAIHSFSHHRECCFNDDCMTIADKRRKKGETMGNEKHINFI